MGGRPPSLFGHSEFSGGPVFALQFIYYKIVLEVQKKKRIKTNTKAEKHKDQTTATATGGLNTLQ